MNFCLYSHKYPKNSFLLNPVTKTIQVLLKHPTKFKFETLRNFQSALNLKPQTFSKDLNPMLSYFISGAYNQQFKLDFNSGKKNKTTKKSYFCVRSTPLQLSFLVSQN